MALLERVTTLIKANLNDLIDKAENPEKLLKQLLLDMENQFMQLKTQVAMAIADQHLLEKKQKEHLDSQRDWLGKAELAIQRNEDDLARTALERSLTLENTSQNFTIQIEDQTRHVHLLRDAMHRLEQKMAETKTKVELLIVRHRRAKLALKANAPAAAEFKEDAAFDRLRAKVMQSEALAEGHIAVNQLPDGRKLAALEKSEQLERLLAELKSKTMRSLGPAN